MKIDFVKTLEASSPYTPGRIYFEESTSLIKVATASNQYRVFGGVRSADYDVSTDILTILNGNGDEVYIDFSQYVNQDEYEDDQYVISVALTELNNNISSISDDVDYLEGQVSDMRYGMQELQNSIENFYFVDGTSSQAGNSTSGSYLSTKWEGQIQGGAITQVYNGLKIAYRIKTNTGVSTAGVVLSIDGTNYYPVVIQKNTMVTTHYPVGSTPLMVFNSTQTATAYLTSNTKTTVTGCWQIMEYDSNTNTYQREYVSSGNVEYPITTRYNTTSGESYYAEYGRYSEGVTLNPSTNTITASGFKITSGTSSQFLKADGTVDSNSYITSSDIPAMTTDASVSGWGYLKANDVSTKVEKSNAVSSLSLAMNSSTYTITLSGTMADGSTFTVGNPVDLPLETMVVDGSYNSSTKKVSLGLKNGSSVEFSVADLVAGLQTEITSSNKLSADLIQDGTTNKVVTATDKNNWNSLVSNVQADWNATSGLAAILNKPTIPSTLDQIADGSTRKLSDYLPLTGGIMKGSAYIMINSSVAENSIYSSYINIHNKNTNSYVEYGSNNILYSPNGNNEYTIHFPQNNGTFALTSNIPTDASVAAWGYIKSYTETDPTVPAWAKAANKPTYTAAEVGALPDTTTIPTQTTDASVAAWGYIKTIADASIAALGYTKNTGTLTGVKFNNTNATVTNGVASITATIPAAPGTLNTNNTTAQTTSASEALSGTINLHKVAKTGAYSDLIGAPLSPFTTNTGTAWFPSYNESLGVTGSLGSTVMSTFGITKEQFSDWSWMQIRYSSGGTTITENLDDRLPDAPTALSQFLQSYFNTSTGKYEWVAVTTLTSNSSDWSWLRCAPASSWTLQDTLNGKQNTLVGSGTGQNIKTVNNNSLVGTGNISVGTLTGVSFNGASASVTNGVAAITATIPTVNNATLTIQKNGTNVNTFTANSSSNVTANIQVNELPTVTASDNGKILQVVNGAWSLSSVVTVYSGSNSPDNSQGVNGDIYIQT